MDYLWTDYRRELFYFSDTAPAFPFEERTVFTKQDRGGNFVDSVGINFLLRFSEIFLPLFKSLTPDNRREVENIFYHFLAQLDRDCGKHKFTFVEELLGQELAKDFYGTRAGEIFRQFNSSAKRKVMRLLRLQEECEGRKLFFREAIQVFFAGAKIYFYEDEEKFLLYLPQEESADGKKIIELLTILFLDISCRTPEIFWGNHFGIIGEPETMRLDQTIIF